MRDQTGDGCEKLGTGERAKRVRASGGYRKLRSFQLATVIFRLIRRFKVFTPLGWNTMTRRLLRTP